MIYEHQCGLCKHEWEAEYKMSDPVPKKCPKCKKTGKVKRLISSGISGKVELTGKDYIKKIKSDAKKEAKSMNEKDYANAIGESKYNSMMSRK